MQVFDFDAALGQVGGQFLGHLLGEGGDEDALVTFDAQPHLFEEVIDLSLGGLDNDERIDETRRANNLLDHAVRALELVGAGGRGEVHGLADALGELVPLERTVVHRGGQTESVVDEGALTRHIAFEHRADLWDGHVGLVDDEQEVVREVVQQRVRRGAGTAPVDVTRIVFHARARPDFLEHLQVEGRAHAQALFLEEFVLASEPREPIIKLFFDGGDRLLHAFLAGHVVRGREQVGVVNLVDHVAGEGVQDRQGVDLVAEHLDADREFLVHGDDFDCVATHAEGAACEGHVVAHVLHGDEAAQQCVAVDDHAALEFDHARHVFLGGAEAVDAGHGGDDDRVAPREQRVRGAVAQPLDLIVDRGILLDEGVRLGDVGFGLVVVVVGDKVLDGVARQQLAELGRKLRGERLVGFQDQRGTLQLLDEPGGGRALARTRRTHEDDVLLAIADARSQLTDRLRLVARRRVGRDDLERLVLADDGGFAHSPTLPPAPWHRAEDPPGCAASESQPRPRRWPLEV